MIRRIARRSFQSTLFAAVLIALLPGPTAHLVASRKLRVITHNIHVAVGMDEKLDLQRIADVIKKEAPDLVGLEEVDRGTRRTDHKDQIVEPAAMTRLEYAFAHNLDSDVVIMELRSFRDIS